MFIQKDTEKGKKVTEIIWSEKWTFFMLFSFISHYFSVKYIKKTTSKDLGIQSNVKNDNAVIMSTSYIYN